jgi:hypothetical protein
MKVIVGSDASLGRPYTLILPPLRGGPHLLPTGEGKVHGPLGDEASGETGFGAALDRAGLYREIRRAVNLRVEFMCHIVTFRTISAAAIVRVWRSRLGRAG